MSAPKFTPGPWGVRPDIGAPVGCLKIAHPDWPRGRTDALVAAVYGYKHEQEANAALIAAAPELYAALEALERLGQLACSFDLLNPCWAARAGDKPGEHWSGIGKACEHCTARAALARARGES